MRHTISVLVENKFGVLTRIAGMFSGRGFNIDTLNVGPTLDPSTSRMTIVVRGDDTVLEQVTKQLNKLVDVIEIQDFRDDEYVDRELLLMRVKVDAKTRAEVMQICDIFRAKIIDVQHKNVSIEVTGNESKIDKFLMLMEHVRHHRPHPHRQGRPRPQSQSDSRHAHHHPFQPLNPSHARKNLLRQRRRSRTVSKTRPAP